MDAFECIATKLEVREFSTQKVPSEIRSKILEAARLTGYWYEHSALAIYNGGEKRQSQETGRR